MCVAFLGNVTRGLTMLSNKLPQDLASASRQELRDAGIDVIHAIRRSPPLDDRVEVVVDSAAGVLVTIVGAILFDKESSLALR